MNQTIQNSLNEQLDYTFAPGIGTEKRSGWIVVLGHGVTGDKDRPVIADTANALNAAGFDTLRFSFAGNGESEGDFGDATISKEVTDLGAVLDTVAGTYSRIVYIGHSMGGAVGVLAASRDKRIDALVSIAGLVNTEAFAKTEFANVRPGQGCMWGDEHCPLSVAFMRDLCETIRTVAPQTETIQIPWLLIHGTADDVVLPKDSNQIKSLKAEAVTLLPVPGADHSFEAPAHKAEMTQGVTRWLSDLASHQP